MYKHQTIRKTKNMLTILCHCNVGHWPGPPVNCPPSHLLVVSGATFLLERKSVLSLVPGEQGEGNYRYQPPPPPPGLPGQEDRGRQPTRIKDIFHRLQSEVKRNKNRQNCNPVIIIQSQTRQHSVNKT